MNPEGLDGQSQLSRLVSAMMASTAPADVVNILGASPSVGTPSVECATSSVSTADGKLEASGVSAKVVIQKESQASSMEEGVSLTPALLKGLPIGELNPAPDGGANTEDEAPDLSTNILPNTDQARRIPCKARGMGETHTHATAYFDIPINLQHGAIMMCSHPACSGSGRRFRFCKVCEVPVAKRNFQKRHGHGLLPVGDPALSGAKLGEQGAENSDAEENDFPKGGIGIKKRKRSISYDAAETLNRLARKKNGHKEKLPGTTVPQYQERQEAIPSSVSMTLTPQEYQWLALLHMRPSIHDCEAMEKWMANVIEVSDKGTTMTRNPSNAGLQLLLPSISSKNISDLSKSFIRNMNATRSLIRASSQAGTEETEKSPPNVTVDERLHEQPAKALDETSSKPTEQRIDRESFQKGDTNIISMSDKSEVHGIDNADESSIFPPPMARIPKPRESTTTNTDIHLSAHEHHEEKIEDESQITHKSGDSRQAEIYSDDEALAEFLIQKAAFSAQRSLERATEARASVGAVAPGEDESQTSSVATRQTVRRRQSVQDARKLMGLIKLSGLKEKDFDEIF